MKYPYIEVKKEDLRRIIYFILLKFRGDPMHRQGTSAKRDLIGGYIERWFNKIAETVIFDDLLKQENFKVVPDYFIYSNDSDKNAPDILGLKFDNKIFPFVKYNDGSWIRVDNMPRIEVKVVRKDQAMVSVREPQMIDDYYVFIESSLEEDYLTSIFEKDIFNKKYFEEIKMSNDFIQSDISSQIIQPNLLEPTERIGSLRLIGIYSKEELRQNSILCGSGVSPYYFGGAINLSPTGRILLSEELKLDTKGRFTYRYNDSYVALPVSFENIYDSKITILKKNKTSVYINSSKSLLIGGINVKEGDIKLEFKKFDRSSSWDENILLKQTLEKYGNDSTLELLDIFKKIVKS